MDKYDACANIYSPKSRHIHVSPFQRVPFFVYCQVKHVVTYWLAEDLRSSLDQRGGGGGGGALCYVLDQDTLSSIACTI